MQASEKQIEKKPTSWSRSKWHQDECDLCAAPWSASGAHSILSDKGHPLCRNFFLLTASFCLQEAQAQQYEKFFRACDQVRSRQNKEQEEKRALEAAQIAALEKAIPPSAADAKKRGKGPGKKKWWLSAWAPSHNLDVCENTEESVCGYTVSAWMLWYSVFI